MSIKFAVLTVSDRSAAGERDDLSGPALIKAINNAGWEPGCSLIVPDEIEEISRILVDWCDNGLYQVILTTGGTGFSSRDVTPEATLQVLDRQAPGLAEAMRVESLKITPHAMLSRAAAGIRKKTLIVNLPGSPKGALENFRIIAPVLPHAVELLTDDSRAEQNHQRSLAA
jgi:molybdopterin adenylyltransferase